MLGDIVTINVAGDDELATVVFEGGLPNSNGWQDTLQVLRLSDNTFITRLNGSPLTWPTTYAYAFRMVGETLGKLWEANQ